MSFSRASITLFYISKQHMFEYRFLFLNNILQYMLRNISFVRYTYEYVCNHALNSLHKNLYFI